LAIPGRLFLGNQIERRALLWQLVRRDFTQRYVGSVAGWLWGLIHPLVLLLSWTFVFQICLKVELPRGEVTSNYTLFLLAGFLPWSLFQETVIRSANSMVEQANLITKTVFPSEILPISIFLSSLIHHLFTLTLLVGAAYFWQGQFSPWIVFLPVYMACAGLLGVGIGWVAGGLQVYLRDTAQVMSVVLTLWFWITPIFVYEEQYPENVRWLLKYNPLAFLVRGYRERVLGSSLPGWDDTVPLIVLCSGLFVLGGLAFRELKRGFADVL
jgi:ABC-type polysaccharide/polyol phosphate export permease